MKVNKGKVHKYFEVRTFNFSTKYQVKISMTNYFKEVGAVWDKAPKQEAWKEQQVKHCTIGLIQSG